MKKTDLSQICFIPKSFPTKSKNWFIRTVCVFLIFGALNSYSGSDPEFNPDRCKRHFVKPKRVKFLPPEKISSLSREETHALQPKHLFQTQADGNLGDLRLTEEQFQALNLNDLHPSTLAAIANREDVVIMTTPAQIQVLDLNRLPSHTVIALMNTPLDLTQKFQELDLSRWPQQDLQLVRNTLSIARHLSREQSDFIKQIQFLSNEENREQQKIWALQKKKEDVEAIPDHGIFDQAIVGRSFDREIIPFLRISELNDDAVEALGETLLEIIQEETPQQKKLVDHIFGNLSNENTRELIRRYRPGFRTLHWPEIFPFIRDHAVLNEAIDSNLFGSAKTAKELYNNMNREMESGNRGMATILTNLRFAELNDKVIEKIRKAAFLHPGSMLTREVSNEHIAELIKREGGLDAVSVPYKSPADGSESSVFTLLFRDNRLTDEIVEYVLSKRPTLLESFDSELMGRIPKNNLKAIVLGDKSSELSESTFQTVLKVGLEVQERYSDKFVLLNIDQVEAMIRNPRFISREEFDAATEKNDWTFYFKSRVYDDIKDRDMPEDFRDGHIKLLIKHLRSLMEEPSLKIQVSGTNLYVG